MNQITLILIPGLLSDGVVWQHSVDQLKARMSIHIADISGFDCITKMAESILQKISGELYVAGHSLGARVALEMFRIAPTRVTKLALIDTGTHPVTVGEPAKRQKVLDMARNEGMAALADIWLPPMVHEDRHNDAELMDALKAMVLRADVAQHDRQIKALLNRPDADKQLAAITCPTLLVVGRQDKWSPVAQHEKMLENIPNARLVIIENAGHFAPIEQPHEMHSILANWIEG